MSDHAPEAGTPQTVIFARIKQYLARTPFEPFRVVATSGLAYEVPTADHAVLFPMTRELHIADDSGGLIELHTLHVSSIERLTRRGRRSGKAARPEWR
jgi:hypothetical protein